MNLVPVEKRPTITVEEAMGFFGCIGKKERIELDIPDGSHRVSVALSAGNGRRGLIRFRQLDPDNE